MAESWERQPGEPERAYEAFLVFRDLGSSRSLSEAYRQKTGRIAAEKPDTTWNRWTKAYNWPARALDYDRHVSAAKTRAVERVADQEGEKWGRRLTAQADADFAFSQKYAAEMARRLNDADRLALMTPRDLKACIDVTAAASGLAWAAIAAALPDTYADLDTSTATTEQLIAAIERLDATIGAASAPVRPRIARAG